MPANTVTETNRGRSVFSELLGSIAERSLGLIDPGRARVSPASPSQLVEACHALLSSKGEATGIALAWQIASGFNQLGLAEKAQFFQAIKTQFGADTDNLLAAAAAYVQAPDDDRAFRLNVAAEPRRQELVRRLNQAPDGTRHVVAMRADLLSAMDQDPSLELVDQDFAHLFYSWFNRGFLELRQINWETSAAILEKIIQYEAVHEISGWDDLRRRIDPSDRRLYAFFHPRLPNEPLIFVEVALTVDVPGSIQEILSPHRDEIQVSAARTAVFYSISNCQKGLRGVSFGNFLIKQVVETLNQEFPALRNFVTLSPIPGFADWLRDQPDWSAFGPALDAWTADPTSQSDDDDHKLAQPMLALAAKYLVSAKDSNVRPRDPVARFHLGNGAILDRINWLADTSADGINRSFSIMVNYRYKLEDIEKHHEAFANAGSVAASNTVNRLARANIRTPNPAT